MEERRFVNVRKEEFGIRQFIKNEFGKGKISSVKIEYTPVGEKITIATHKPGIIIGKKGESIERLTNILKKKFKMENPHIDIGEITRPEFDATIVADEIALSLERFGPMRFKAVTYRMLDRIKKGGALGAELVVSGKLPSDRAKTWRFAFGYLKKTGDGSNAVDRAQSVAVTKQGVVGIRAAILAPTAKLQDHISLDEETMNLIKNNASFEEVAEVKKKKKAAKKTTKKKVVKETEEKETKKKATKKVAKEKKDE